MLSIRSTSTFLFSTAATIFLAQNASANDKPNSPKHSHNINDSLVSTSSKAKFDKNEVEKLARALGNNAYTVRELAYSKLLQIPKNLSLHELNDFLIFITNEIAKPISEKDTDKSNSVEKNRRLILVEQRVFETLKYQANKSTPSKRTEVTLKLIEIMDKNRSASTWRDLTPVIVDLTVNDEHKRMKLDPRILAPLLNPAINLAWGPFAQNPLETKIKGEPKVILPLSKLLLSPFNQNSKDTQELKKEAVKQIISLTKSPLCEQEPFISFHNIKLKALTELPEDKLNEIEPGLKELKALYSQINWSHSLQSKITLSAKPYLEELLEKNINAFSTNDPKKQSTALSNITALKDQFNFGQVNNFFVFPQIVDLISTKNGSLIFEKRNEFSKSITSTKELLSSIEIAGSISEISRNDTNYHKSYITWLEKQIDNSALQKLSDKEEIQNTLEYALTDKLYTLAKGGYRTPLQAEIISPLIRTYTKLAQQRSSNPNSLGRNLDVLLEFKYFSLFHLQKSEQEKLYPQLLTLLDTVTDGINKLPNTKDKANLRKKVIIAGPDVDIAPKGNKDYVSRLSNFYCKKKEINTNEFMGIIDSLLNSPHPEYVGNHLPPETMLQFIENNPKYFEDNVKHLIKIYKTSNTPSVKSISFKQLQIVDSSFKRLFNERHKVSHKLDYYNTGWLTQYYPSTGLANVTEYSSTNLEYHPDLTKQMARIEAQFNPLQKLMNETILLKGK